MRMSIRLDWWLCKHRRRDRECILRRPFVASVFSQLKQARDTRAEEGEAYGHGEEGWGFGVNAPQVPLSHPTSMNSTRHTGGGKELPMEEEEEGGAPEEPA